MFVRLDAFLNVSCSTHLVALRFFFSKAETFPASSSCMFRMQWQVLITCAKVGVVAWFSLLFQLLVMTQTVCCFFTQPAHMGPYALSEVAFRLECQCLGFFFFFQWSCGSWVVIAPALSNVTTGHSLRKMSSYHRQCQCKAKKQINGCLVCKPKINV